jgi:Mce-associated membrane protein
VTTDPNTLADELEVSKDDPVDEAHDEDTDADVTDDASDDDDVAGEGSPRRWGRVGIAVLAILLFASGGLTAWLYFHTYRPDQQTNPAATQVVLDAAKDGTVATLSYSPEKLDADLQNAKSHLTGDFLKYYTDFTDQVVRPAVQQKQVTTTANVVRAAVSEMHPDTATVLVFVNQTTTSADRADPSMATSSVVVKMSKVDGKWLISEFNPI